MTTSTMTDHDGGRGRLMLHKWNNAEPSSVAVLVHGIAEHSGRYEHVAKALVDAGAVVYSPDQWGHGLSDGVPGIVDDVDAMAEDVSGVVSAAKSEYPGLPVAVIGHSLGGIIATRYAQKHPDGLDALVLSAPVIGGNAAIFGLLEMEQMPDVPIDPAFLSRDPSVGEAYLADPLVYTGPLRRESLVAIKESVANVAAGGGLGTLPTLWIHGEEDGLAPLAETQVAFDRIGGDRLESKVYPGAPRNLQRDEPG